MVDCTSYLCKFSVTGGLGLNVGFIFLLENAGLLDVGICRRATFTTCFLRAVMDLLNGKVGRERSSLGTQGEDRERCVSAGLEQAGPSFYKRSENSVLRLFSCCGQRPKTGGEKPTEVGSIMIFFSRER